LRTQAVEHEPFNPADRRLLADLARQAGVARCSDGCVWPGRSDSGQVEVLASVATADELLDAVGRLAPEAVITDIRMPPAHHVEGIEAALRIWDGYPDVGVVVLSQHSHEAYALKLFHAGTAGLAYLLKERVADLEGLLRALREVTVGGSVVDPLIVEALVTRRLRRKQSGLDQLTPREFDVLREMA
jgi:DNA-binding NarL/FixJ family response regulator